MKNYDKICLPAILALVIILLCGNGYREKSLALAARISPEILRFHVIANSDRSEDQALKLEIKDLLLETIQTDLKDLASDPSSASSTLFTKESVCAYICANKANLEALATDYMASCGFSYQAEIRMEPWEFPEKTYGDVTFPAGTYDAVRVLIGEAKGQNFWCVLYPTLCYLDASHAVVPEDSKELLKTLIPEDDFAALLASRRPQALFQKSRAADAPDQQKTEPDSRPRIKFGFQLLEWLE